MTTSSALVRIDARREVARAVVAIGLFGIALVHLLDLPGKLEETPYLGFAYIALIVVSAAVGVGMTIYEKRWQWMVACVVAVATLGGYVVNRTVGMPGAMDDIGNWLEPLGLASLFIEGAVAVLSAAVLAGWQ